MKPTVAVVGAGVAGMTAAVHLALAGFRVTLLDKGSRPGGRTLSWQDPSTGDWLDNGPHLLMGCYRETLRLLDRLGTRDQLLGLPPRTVWLAPGGRRHLLKGNTAFHRLGLLWGVLRLNSLGWQGRWRVLRAMQAAGQLNETQLAELNERTCLEWLRSLRQTPETIARFWEPLLVAALNEKADRAAADGLAAVIRVGFLSGPAASRLFVPRTCLRDLFQPALGKLLRNLEGRLLLRTRARRLQTQQGRVTAVELAGGERIQADSYVLALPPRPLAALLPEDSPSAARLKRNAESFTYSPIVSLYLWLSQAVLEEAMIGLLDSPLHWVFQRPLETSDGGKRQLLSVPLSAAQEWVPRPPATIKEQVVAELSRFIPALSTETVTHWRVIKERRATVSLGPGTASSRPGAKSPWPNLFLAGDWTATGLPATIESAALSGRASATLTAHRTGVDSKIETGGLLKNPP